MNSSNDLIKVRRKRASATKYGKQISLVRSELSLFDEPPFDVTLTSGLLVEHYPMNVVSDRTTPITFFIQGTDQQFIDLRETRIYVRGKILQPDGKKLLDADEVAPVNNFLHSLFNQCTVWLNETQVTPPNMYYAYRAYIEMLLGYGKEYKKSQAQCNMYYREKDVENTDKTVQDGYKKRYDLTKKSQTFELYGRPHSDLFLQTRYLIPGIDMRIQFERATDDFCLVAPTVANQKSFKVDLDEVILYVKKQNILPSLAIGILKSWESGQPIAYPMKKVEIKTFSIATGTMQVINENLITGQVPDRVIVGIVSSQNLHGTQTTNPFVFKDHNLRYINASVDGDQISGRPLELSFQADGARFMRAFYNIFDSLGYTDCDVGLDMTFEEFKNGKQLYVFQLRPLSDSFTTPKYGNVKLELKFNPGTTESLTVVVYAEYQSVLYIDNTKSIYYKDYSISS
jgi:hypothetical protein